MADYKLWGRFCSGEAKVFDFTSLLNDPAFQPLKEPSVFRSVYIDYGVPESSRGSKLTANLIILLDK